MSYLTFNGTRVQFGGKVLKFSKTIIYDDWFLPSNDELKSMRDNLRNEGVGNFSDNPYWCSTEHDANSSYRNRFAFGDVAADVKSTNYLVRPCRSFTSTESYSLRDVGPAGGWIFHKNGDTYYEAGTTDFSERSWSNITDSLAGTNSSFGTGSQNSLNIVDQIGHTSSAALDCLNYSV